MPNGANVIPDAHPNVIRLTNQFIFFTFGFKHIVKFLVHPKGFEPPNLHIRSVMRYPVALRVRNIF